MELVTSMRYLGFTPGQSKKTGNSYILAKFMEEATAAIFQFYVPADRLQVITDIGQLQSFAEVKIKLLMTSYNNEPKIDLIGVQVPGKGAASVGKG